MRRSGSLLATLCAVLLVCAALVGCGGSGANNEEVKKNFVATWAIESMVTGDKAMSDNELAVVKALGFYLTIQEDGTATLEMLGTPISATWEAKDATTATLKLSSAQMQDVELSGEQEMKIADAKLTMADGQNSMTFVKIDPSEKNAKGMDTLLGDLQTTSTVTSDLATQLSGAQQLDTVIGDDENCTVKVVSKGDYFGDPAFLVSATNHTDAPIHVDDNNEFDINGVTVSPVFSMDLAAGETKTEMLWFENKDINNGGVDALNGVNGQIIVTNANNEEIARYDFIM